MPPNAADFQKSREICGIDLGLRVTDHLVRWTSSEVAQDGIYTFVGHGFAAMDASGVDAEEEDFDAVAGAVGDFGGGDAGVEPERDGGVPECVWPVREW